MTINLYNIKKLRLIQYLNKNKSTMINNQMNNFQKDFISNEERRLLEEWIKQIEELKNDLNMMKQEGQCGIIVSDLASKLSKIHTGIQLWKTKNIDKEI